MPRCDIEGIGGGESVTTAERKPGTRSARHKNRATHVSFHEDEGEARLPGRVLVRDAPLMRLTKVTFLPTCTKCRRYPAREIAPNVYDCGGQHD